MARMLRVPTRLPQWFADQGGTSVLSVVIPGVRKVPQSGPGVFPGTDALVRPCYGVNRFRHHGSLSLSDPNSTFSAFWMVAASSCCAVGRSLRSNVLWAFFRVR